MTFSDPIKVNVGVLFLTFQQTSFVRSAFWLLMESHSCNFLSWWLYIWWTGAFSRIIYLLLYFVQESSTLPEIEEEVLAQKRASLPAYASALNLTCGHREGSEKVLCCWSPPLPFACLSDVLLGWAPHCDGVDKMTGGGHTPVNVNFASTLCFPRTSEAPAHSNRRRGKTLRVTKILGRFTLILCGHVFTMWVK